LKALARMGYQHLGCHLKASLERGPEAGRAGRRRRRLLRRNRGPAGAMLGGLPHPIGQSSVLWR
jgi:hypothetical protein